MPKEIQKKCPLVGEECWGHECEWFQKIQGSHPQTGALIDEYMCAHLWNNILLIENSQMQRETGAAVESFRNEMKKDNSALIPFLSAVKPRPEKEIKTLPSDANN